MTTAVRLSVVIITLDSEELLPGNLASLPAGVEVVVADGGSRDATVEVARGQGARVLEQDRAAIREAGGVFDVARNAAAEAAAGEWILHLDADERLSPALRQELQELLAGEPSHAAYEIPRSNLFWGRAVRLLGADPQRRLVRRGLGRFTGEALHRPLEVSGSVGRLRSPIIHLNARGWRDVVRRFRRDVPIQARRLGCRPTWREVLTRPLHLFRHYYQVNEAWRDGARGLAVSAIYAVYHGAILWTARRSDDAGR